MYLPPIVIVLGSIWLILGGILVLAGKRQYNMAIDGVLPILIGLAALFSL